MRIAWDRSRHGEGEGSTTTPGLLPPRLLCIALVLALLSTIVSLSASAAEVSALPDADAEAAYDSAEAAFAAVFINSGLGERAYQENREYAAAIYQLPDGHWHCTAVVAGGQTASAIPYHAVPPQALRIVGAHTHGQPHIPDDPWHLYGVDFSQADLRNAGYNYRATHGRIAVQLLLTSELKILRLTITGEPALAPSVLLVHVPEHDRLTPGAIHGTTEQLGQLPPPAAPHARAGSNRLPASGGGPAETELVLGQVATGSAQSVRN